MQPRGIGLNCGKASKHFKTAKSCQVYKHQREHSLQIQISLGKALKWGSRSAAARSRQLLKGGLLRLMTKLCNCQRAKPLWPMVTANPDEWKCVELGIHWKTQELLKVQAFNDSSLQHIIDLRAYRTHILEVISRHFKNISLACSTAGLLSHWRLGMHSECKSSCRVEPGNTQGHKGRPKRPRRPRPWTQLSKQHEAVPQCTLNLSMLRSWSTAKSSKVTSTWSKLATKDQHGQIWTKGGPNVDQTLQH